MRKVLMLTVALFLLASATRQGSIGVNNCTEKFRADAHEFAARIRDLNAAIETADSTNAASVERAKHKLTEARLAYKRIAFFLEYFFFTSSRIYNRPPKNEIEEPNLEYMEPAGLQYIEALLFDDPIGNKTEMLQQCRLLQTAADDLPALLYNFKATDAQILESVRIELVRVITLSITGFDAPLLKTGLGEALVSLETIDAVLKPYLKRADDTSVANTLVSSLGYLRKNTDFDTFDRLHFLTHYALPLQEQLGRMIAGLGLELNEKGILNYGAQNLFSPNTFAPAAFGRGANAKPALTELGKKLFFETRLSANGTRSCASCHNPALHFADGLPKSIGIHPGATVRRNAPSLLYGTFQHAQFWDGRAKTLEEQISTVIHDSLEMNGKPTELIRKLARKRDYRHLIRQLQPDRRQLADTIVYQALAAFVRTLQPFNSDFDRYIQGDHTALSDRQVNGFNLFMGKAQCGTCHFAPLFNGLIPPLYTLTEFEILGTTASDNLESPAVDEDDGRFETRPTPYYRAAFKTPTVRNAAVTAPYMHNGAFGSLEKVMEFYDRGGGSGLGVKVPNQTLAATPLNLTEQEKSDIIAFLHALTDRL